MLEEENSTNFNSKPANFAWPVLEEEDCAKAVLEEEDCANAVGSVDDEAVFKCAACEETYMADDGHLWIGCDHCERWFHGKCVGISPEKAEEIERYMCPGCSYRSKIKASY